MKTINTAALPRIVSRAQWRDARNVLLLKEKQATRTLDALAAERRRLHPFRSSFMAMGDGTHKLPVRPEIRNAINKQVGDEVTVHLREKAAP